MRVAVFATHDSQGIVDEYILFCLKELKNVADDIIVVSNHELSLLQKKKLYMATTIIERDDEGYDVGGYCAAINFLKKKELLSKYDEMIIMNDSVFGPFYPFDEMFNEMDKKPELDFWGITYRGESNFDGSDAIYPRHIQLYFYVIRKRMLHSKIFEEYWNHILDKITDFRSAIINYEFKFTKYFEDNGFIWDVYCKTPEYDTEKIAHNLSPYHYCTAELIREKRCPLMKRKLFTGDFIDARFTNKSDAKNALKFVMQNTKYDTNLIWKHILRVYPIATVMHSMQMTEIISSDDSIEQNLKLANMIQIIDLSNSKKFQSGNNIYEINNNYVMVLRFNDENDLPYVLSESFKSNIKKNLIKNDIYIGKIIKLFEKEELLGLVIPPIHYFDKILFSIENRTETPTNSSFVNASDPLCIPVHRINAFICRSELLSQELLNELAGEDGLSIFRYMPYIVQKRNFYTKTVIESNWAVSLVENGKNTLLEIFNSIQIDSDNDYDIDGIKEKIIEYRINAFAAKFKNIYIYGAGGLAVKVAKLINNKEKIKNIIVTDICGNTNEVLQIKVVEFNKDLIDGGIIVAVGKKNSEIIKRKLFDSNIDQYIIVE